MSQNLPEYPEQTGFVNRSIPNQSIDDKPKHFCQQRSLQMLECDGHSYQEQEKLTMLEINYEKPSEILNYENLVPLEPDDYYTLILARGVHKDWSKLVYSRIFAL